MHVLNDELVDFSHARQINFALRRELLRGNEVFGERMRNPGSREVADAQQPGLHILRGLSIVVEHLDGLLDQHGKTRQRSVKQSQAAAADETCRSKPGQQQQTKAARDAAACKHQKHDENNIGAYLHRELQMKVASR